MRDLNDGTSLTDDSNIKFFRGRAATGYALVSLVRELEFARVGVHLDQDMGMRNEL